MTNVTKDILLQEGSFGSWIVGEDRTIENLEEDHKTFVEIVKGKVKDAQKYYNVI